MLCNMPAPSILVLWDLSPIMCGAGRVNFCCNNKCEYCGNCAETLYFVIFCCVDNSVDNVD
jgi:hypothetical protein